MRILRNDDGAALISVLLLVSVMSVAMVAMFDMLGFYTKRTVSSQNKAQALEYAKASEIIGADQAVKLATQQGLVAYLGENKSAQQVTMPIENGMIAGELIDDCALARRIKSSGGRIRLALATETRSIRVYGTLAATWRMVARTVFHQLNYSVIARLGTVIGMFFFYLSPR